MKFKVWAGGVFCGVLFVTCDKRHHYFSVVAGVLDTNPEPLHRYKSLRLERVL